MRKNNSQIRESSSLRYSLTRRSGKLDLVPRSGSSKELGRRTAMNDLYITVKPGMTLHITVAGDGDVQGGGPVPGPGPERRQDGPDATLAAALDRLERSGSPYVREVAEGLTALGYDLVPANSRTEGKRPENYMRFHDPARPGPAIGYRSEEHTSELQSLRHL